MDLFKIKIDAISYHKNVIDNKTKNIINKIIKSTLEVYPNLNIYINEHLNSLKGIKVKKEFIIFNFFVGIIKEFNDDNMKFDDDSSFIKSIKVKFISFFPYLIKNIYSFPLNRYYAYQPKNIVSLYLLTEMRNTIDLNFENFHDDEKDQYLILLMNNIIRSLKSSLTLFIIGDDVHAYGLFRGIIDLLARFNQFEKNSSKCIEYQKLNNIIQQIKMNDKVNDDDLNRVQKFLKEHKLTMSTVENYLLYGWANDKNGNPLLTEKKFIEESFDKDQKHLLEIYHFASELIHEDYIWAKFDYINIRIRSIDFIYAESIIFAAIMSNIFNFDTGFINLLKSLTK